MYTVEILILEVLLLENKKLPKKSLLWLKPNYRDLFMTLRLTLKSIKSIKVSLHSFAYQRNVNGKPEVPL